MTSLENMMFSKYVSNNNIAMNTKTEIEREEIALSWLIDQHEKAIKILNQTIFLSADYDGSEK